MRKSFIAHDTFGASIGGVYYLVKVVPNHGPTRHEIRQAVPVKNSSMEECVEGWLGETNNINQYAMGLVRVLGFGQDDCSVRVVATAE